MSDKLDDRTHYGIAMAPGVAIGHVRLIEDVHDMAEKGDIVVVHDSSSEWLVQLLKAEAVIAEYGGRVSHLAILCRQLGKPGVSAIEGAFTMLKDGDLVTVDGSCGKVIIHD